MYVNNLSWRELVRNLKEQIKLSETYLDFYHSTLKTGGPAFPWGPIYRSKSTIHNLEQILLFIKNSHKTGIADRFDKIKDKLQSSEDPSLFTFESFRSLLLSSIRFSELEQLLQIAVCQRVTNTQMSEIHRIGGAALFKVFSACEGLVLNYYNLLTGDPNLKQTKIRFATIFGSKSVFQMSLLRSKVQFKGMEGIGFINLPEFAFHRVRFWPALAHEISHFFAKDFLANKEDTDLRLKLSAFTNTIRGVLVNLTRDINILAEYSLRHAEELLSDILATLIAGPSFTQTILSLRPYESSFYHPLTTHPPILIRGNLSSGVLRFMGFKGEAERTQSNIDELVRKFMHRVKIERPSSKDYSEAIWQFLKIYSESVESYVNELCELFTTRNLRSRLATRHRIKVKHLDSNKRNTFRSIADKFERNAIPSPIPSPNDAINSVWQNRNRREISEQTRLTDICLWCMDRWYRQRIEQERR